MPNQLAHETSPYLLQHANNPVDWHPWGPEALQKSKDEDKPIFLSIGYSACQSAIAGAQLLIALDMNLGPTPAIVILGNQDEPETSSALRDLRRRFVPNRVVACRAATEAGGSPNLAKAFAGKAAQDGSPTVFVCAHFTCQTPVIGQEAARKMWEKLAMVAKGP